MKEKDLEQKVMRECELLMPRCELWKIHDTVTGGRPDLEVAWSGQTSKIEFKLLKKGENIHDKWEDERQLITMYRYEQQTFRGYVVAFQLKSVQHGREHDLTHIYRPKALLDRKIPKASVYFDSIPYPWQSLWLDNFQSEGVITLLGLRPDLVALFIKCNH
jgi:hypothetical protein